MRYKANEREFGGRVEHIDIIRGIGILLMIMGHIGFGKNFDIYIHAFHMPVFYVVSGYLFKTESVPTENYIVKKARQLLLPYFSFSAISFFMAYILNGAEAIDFWKELNDTFFNPTIGQVTFAGALWFLPALFWINIIFHFLHKWFGKNDYILFVITLMIGFAAMLATDYNIYLPMGLDAALVGVAFAGTGYFLKQMSQKKNINFFFHINIVIYIVIVVLHKKLIFLNGLVNFRTGDYQNIFLTYFNAVLGTILLWNLSNWLKQIINKWEKVNFIKVIEQIGANSLTFVCLKQLVIIVVSQRLGVEILENSNIPYFKETVMLFVVCFILYVMMVVLENSMLKVILGRSDSSGASDKSRY